MSGHDDDRTVVVTSGWLRHLHWISTEAAVQTTTPPGIYLIWCRGHLLGFASEASAALLMAEEFAQRLRITVVDRTLETWPDRPMDGSLTKAQGPLRGSGIASYGRSQMFYFSGSDSHFCCKRRAELCC